MDAGATDLGTTPRDGGVGDTGVGDLGSARDAGPVADMDVSDVGPADTGPADTGPADSGDIADSGDTGPADVGPADTGPADTGPTDMGSCADADDDMVCDIDDICPGFNDAADADMDNVPDGCDACTGNDASGDTDMDQICNDTDICPGGAANRRFFEDFESGGASFTLNVADLGSATNGANQWTINSTYTGGSGTVVCMGFPFSFTIPPMAAQPSGVVSGPQSHYLHTVSDAGIASGIVTSGLIPSDGFCFFDESIFATMNRDVDVTGLDEVELSYFWAFGGGTNVHGDVYFSTDGGTSWTLAPGGSQLKNQATWAQQTLVIPVTGETTLRVGFRAVNNTTAIYSDPGFSLDDVAVRCR